MTRESYRQALAEQGAAALERLAQAREEVRLRELELADIASHLAPLMAEDDQISTDHGPLVIRRGRVLARATPNVTWLEEHYEELPAELRQRITTDEIATVHLSGVDEATQQAIRDSPSARISVRHKWPTIGDIETFLSRTQARQAITPRERAPATLALLSGDLEITHG